MSNKNYQKSAKDIAFDRERSKYHVQIRELERQLKYEKLKNSNLLEDNEKKNQEIESLKEWINRLLEYTELSEDEMKKIIQKEKNSIAMNDMFTKFFGMYGRVFGY